MSLTKAKDGPALSVCYLCVVIMLLSYCTGTGDEHVGVCGRMNSLTNLGEFIDLQVSQPV